MSPHETTIAEPGARRRGLSWLIAAGLFLTTVAVFISARQGGFVDWDDPQYVSEQPRVLEGITPSSLAWAMTAVVSANWHPLTLMSLQLDAQLFGPGPTGFHLTSIFIHTVNAALAFLALQTLTGCRWRSLVVAALFALHPMRVESVAWISERKDVLSGFFFFWTLIAYASYVRAPSIARYLLVAVLLALGLSAKSMLVTVPCVLLLLDYWPLGRAAGLAGSAGRRFGRLFLEKVPLLGLSAVISVIILVCQQSAMGHRDVFGVARRLENAVRGTASYLLQTCWPTGLSPLYAFPDRSLVWFSAALMLLLMITGIAVWQRQRRPYLLVGWLWFLGMLVPVCGLIQVGSQQRADRYMYLPQIGLFLGVIWFAADLVRNSRSATILVSSFAAGYLALCGWLTVEQIRIWQSTTTLWQHALQLDPQNRSVLRLMIIEAFKQNDREEALRLANDLIELENESRHFFLSNLANFLADQGENEAALRAYNKAIELRPDPKLSDSELFLFRGTALAALGRWEEAVDDFRHAGELTPQAVPLRISLAHALSKMGSQAESDEISAAVLQRSPRFPDGAALSAWSICTDPDASHRNRFMAVCLAEQINAMTQGQQSRYLDVLAAGYAALGRFEEAVTTANLAIERATAEGRTAQATAIRSRLELYKKRQPYFEEPVRSTGSAKL